MGMRITWPQVTSVKLEREIYSEMFGNQRTENERVDLEQYIEWSIGFWVAPPVGWGPPRKGKSLRAKGRNCVLKSSRRLSEVLS